MSFTIMSTLVVSKRFSCPAQLGAHPGDSEYFIYLLVYPGRHFHFHFQGFLLGCLSSLLSLSFDMPCTPWFATRITNAYFRVRASGLRMAFRRPPPDVDRMTSLRVGNLPYSVVIEVGDWHLPSNAFPKCFSSIFHSGLGASF